MSDSQQTDPRMITVAEAIEELAAFRKDATVLLFETEGEAKTIVAVNAPTDVPSGVRVILGGEGSAAG